MEDPSYPVRLHTTVVNAIKVMFNAWARPDYKDISFALSQSTYALYREDNESETAVVTMTLKMWNVVLEAVEVLMGPEVWSTIKDQLPE